MTAPLGRRDKQVLLDFESNVREFNKQFGDQQRMLDIRNENKIALITDIQEFFKRRSELDLDYGKNLDRICERFQERLQKQRATYGLAKKDRASYVNLWSKLLIDAKFKAKTATTLSEIYSKNIVTRLTEIAEDIQRIAKSVKDTHLLLEVEIKKQVNILQTDMRMYYMKLNDFMISKAKFDASDDNMKKAGESPLKKGNEKRMKQLEKNLDKKRTRLLECQEKAINGRNEYILSVESVCAVLNKYYHHDLSDIVMKYDHNFHDSFSATLQAFMGAEVRMANAQIQSADSLAHSVTIMDADNDIKMFLEDNDTSFIQAMKFQYLSASHDEVQSITADVNIEAELIAKQKELHNAIKSLQVELSDLQVQMEKRNGGLDATYKKYDAEMNGFYHVDMTLLGQSTPTTSTLTSNPPQQLKVDKEEWETGLLTKFKEKIMSENLLIQKQAKYDSLTKALGEIALDSTRHNNVLTLSGSKRSVKLFGTSLKQQLDDTGRDIPDIVESCAKYIARFGLKHQGIFRVPGASQEISDMKLAFEEGRDPLSGLNHWKDINAVAGVFRAYFRESGEPLFPYIYNQDYLRVTSITKLDEQVAEAKAILKKIPDWNVHVIKYMLKFLNLIGQYSEQNKMTSHNLAVVFGPTLFRVADNENLLTKQGQINVFIELLISEFYQIFPDEPREGDFDELDQADSDEDDINHEEHELDHTEDELSELEDTDYTTEAIALHDFTARSAKEISFSKGDKIKIYTKTTPDWWDAKVDGKYGYVPVSYIKIQENSRAPISESGIEHKKEGKKSQDECELSLPLEKRLHTSSECETSPTLNPADEAFKDLDALSDGESEHCGNVFAAIDPTCSTDISSPMKRIGSERSPKLLKMHSPVRAHSDKRDVKPVVHQSNNITDSDLSSDDLHSSITVQPPTPSAKQTASLPHTGKSSMFVVSQHDLIANKLRSPSENLDEKKDDRPLSTTALPSELERVRVKDKCQAFSPQFADRPMSQVLRPILGHMQIECADRPSPVPNFKPPPPPPALKPKPTIKKKVVPQHVVAGINKESSDGKDVTRL